MDEVALKERYNPEGSKLRKNQLELVDILLDLAKICREHNIQWWLSSGTLLGAARHKGFIPWDDDIDIVMFHKDFKRLQRILHKLDSDKYVYQSMFSDIEYTNLYGKFRRRDNTVAIFGGRYKYLKYKGQFVDIFSIEKTNHFAARAAKVIYHNLQHTTIHIKTKWLRHAMIRFIEFLCFFIVNPILRVIGVINPRGEYHYTLGSGWDKHTFYMKYTLPLSTIHFEGHEFPAPKDVDGYLRNVYGDWRKMPSDEEILKAIHCKDYREEIFSLKQQ